MSTVLRKAFGGITDTAPINKAFTGTAAAQAVIANTVYRVVATQDCHITLDGTTATTSYMRIVADVPEIIVTRPGQTSLSVISAGTDGTIQLVEKSAEGTF